MNKGFTLVELSIVLVILGLLTGGILAGQNLIRSAELRAVTTEYDRYIGAVHSFKDKYFRFPGDLNNATDFWGTMTNCDAASPSGTGTQTCDGDGDGRLDAPGAALQTGETFAFWQHLANAGLIEGSYTGIGGSDTVFNAVLDENVPRSRMTNAGWYAGYISQSGSGSFTDNLYENSLVFGADNDNGYTYKAALSPQEAWNIDTKMDDGLPQRGFIWAVRWDNCTDAADETVLNAAYLLSDSSIQCALIFKDIF